MVVGVGLAGPEATLALAQRGYRVNQILQMSDAPIYPGSRMTPEDVRQFGARHVVVATDAR